MKIKRVHIFTTVLTLLIFSALIFVRVPTKQGVNYKISSYKMPLYIKIIEFLDRDYQYRRIVKEIITGKFSGQDKVVAIFNWCVVHIKHRPEELPLFDDHPLNIIIRGYGEGDQFEDIFTILCTYAGFEAFYKEFKDPAKGAYLLSFVKIDSKWHPFSVSNNVYATMDGRLASNDDILNNPSLISQFSSRIPSIETKFFLRELENTTFKATSIRVRGQSPAGRLRCYLNNIF